MKPNTVILILVATGALVGLAVWSASSEKSSPVPSAGSASSSSDGAGKPFFPVLSEKAATASTITVKRPEFTFNIVKGTDDIWHVPEKGNYPAKMDIVRQVLVGLSELHEWEPKTNRPEMYSKLGLDEPVAPPPEKSATVGLPQSTQVTVKDAAGATLADAIVGNRKPAQSSSQTGVYVRRVGESQAWLARGDVNVPREILGWLDAQFANLDRARVKSVTIRQPELPPLVVSRENPSVASAIQGIPAGRELKDPGVGDTLAATLTMINFPDVAKLDSIDFSGAPDGKPGPTVEVRTFDGLVVNIVSVVKEGRQWWKLVATSDDALIAANAGTDAEKGKADAEKIHKEVADLNASWAPYAFAPLDFKARNLNQTMDDYLKPPADANTPSTPGAGTAPPMAPGAPQIPRPPKP